MTKNGMAMISLNHPPQQSHERKQVTYNSNPPQQSNERMQGTVTLQKNNIVDLTEADDLLGPTTQQQPKSAEQPCGPAGQ